MKEIKLSSILITILAALFNVLIILFPTDMIGASKEGLRLWFNEVLPSLLPFVIGTNILAGVGAISFIGVLLSPLMYRVFGVPGAGGFALVTGMTSGYPIGAKVTATLLEKNEVSTTEGQRLLSFANNSGPLFVLGAVGLGMFKSAQVGYFLMAVHYLSAIITGMIFKYYKYEGSRKVFSEGRIMRRALRGMRDAREKDGRPFGQIFGDSVKNAMESVFIVGGFIILFCVLTRIFDKTNIAASTYALFEKELAKGGINGTVYKGLIMGFMEITNGINCLVKTDFSKAQVLTAAFLISFGGFSIHAQTASFLSKSGVNFLVYIGSKLVHALITVVIGYFMFPFFNLSGSDEAVMTYAVSDGNVLEKLLYSSVWFFISVGVIFGGILLFYVFSKVKARKVYTRRVRRRRG